jgi:probable blue pigment (indigoidine) exporter
MKHLLTEWPPLSARGLCGIAGAAALALFALARRQELSVPRAVWLRLLIVSMLSIGGGLGCLPIAIVGLAVEQPQLAALSYVGWLSLLYMTLIQFWLCHVCWFAALERLPAATASIGTLLVPVIGVLAAAAMLRESLGLREIAALVFTLGGVAVAPRA